MGVGEGRENGGEPGRGGLKSPPTSANPTGALENVLSGQSLSHSQVRQLPP